MIFGRKKDPLIRKKNIMVIYGIHPGAGLRHFSISMGVYLAKIRRKKTVYIEVDKESRLLDILGEVETSAGVEVGFSAFGCDVFPGLSSESAFAVLGEDYEEVIITVTDPKTYLPIPGDARVFFLGSLKPWHFQEYRHFLRSISRNEYILGCCLSYGLTDGERRLFCTEFGKDVSPVPFIADPMSLDHAEMKLISSIYGG